MKSKSAASLSPLLLILLSGAARADLEPFSVGASETVSHDNNINHSEDADRVSAWMSTTEIRAALDEPVGRNQLTASAAANYTTYNHVEGRDNFGYRAATRFNWSTIGDLSGSFGADSQRRRYVYGVEGGEQSSTVTSNQETTNHGFAQIELGGLARWNIFAGFDAMNRDYSADSFSANDEKQWSTNFGTRYSTSPDLSFGVTASYTHGEYPHYVDILGDPASAGFSSRSVSLTTRLQASGNSSFSGSIGYTTQDSDLQPTMRFVSGALSWNWEPPSHFKVHLGLARSSNGGATSGTSVSTLNDRSLNNTASAAVTYLWTAKVSIVGNADYIQRKYSGVQVPILNDDGSASHIEFVDGTNHTQRFGITAHYQPTRTTDLSCGASHESLSAGSVIRGFTPNYTDTSYRCAASINLN
jgi:hypothetical protein